MMRQDLVETNFLPDDPELLPTGVELFALGDVHGRDRALARALEHIRTMPTPAGARRILVHAGDVCDRGPGTLPAMRMLADAKALAGVDEVHLLPGNHELMLFDALATPFDPVRFEIWAQNGGDAVLVEAEAYGEEKGFEMPTGAVGEDDRQTAARRLLAVLKQDPDLRAWYDALMNGPDHFRLGNVVVVHGGVDPHRGVDNTLALPRKCHSYANNHWAWVRKDFLAWERGWTCDGAMLVVHGHTCAFKKLPLWHDDDEQILRHMDKAATHRRANIDAGAAAREVVGGVHLRAGARKFFVAQPEV